MSTPVTREVISFLGLRTTGELSTTPLLLPRCTAAQDRHRKRKTGGGGGAVGNLFCFVPYRPKLCWLLFYLGVNCVCPLPKCLHYLPPSHFPPNFLKTTVFSHTFVSVCKLCCTHHFRCRLIRTSCLLAGEAKLNKCIAPPPIIRLI